jgi:hypothetical protein
MTIESESIRLTGKAYTPAVIGSLKRLNNDQTYVVLFSHASKNALKWGFPSIVNRSRTR